MDETKNTPVLLTTEELKNVAGGGRGKGRGGWSGGGHTSTGGNAKQNGT